MEPFVYLFEFTDYFTDAGGGVGKNWRKGWAKLKRFWGAY
jgi:hypothetical protein